MVAREYVCCATQMSMPCCRCVYVDHRHAEFDWYPCFQPPHPRSSHLPTFNYLPPLSCGPGYTKGHTQHLSTQLYFHPVSPSPGRYHPILDKHIPRHRTQLQDSRPTPANQWAERSFYLLGAPGHTAEHIMALVCASAEGLCSSRGTVHTTVASSAHRHSRRS
jgi:hypothetical protein